MALTIKFKSCCKECSHRDTYLNEEDINITSNNVVIDNELFTEIGCKHESVCNAYYKDDNYLVPRHIRHDFDEIILESRRKAEEVLSYLMDIIVDYGQVTVSDLYDYIGIQSNFTDEKYGWIDLRGSIPRRVRGGYSLDLPKPQLLY